MIEQIVDLTQLQEDIQLLHSFVHGAEGDSVVLGRVNTPSLRNLVSTIQKNVSLLIEQYTTHEDRIAQLEESIAQLRASLALYEETVSDGETTYDVRVLSGLVEVPKDSSAS